MSKPTPIRYSAETGGFYHVGVHHADQIPADAVAVSAQHHAALIEAHAAGDKIVADAAGRPRIATRSPTIEDRRTQVIATIRREARRRILAIASLAQQSNDNAALALAAIDGAPPPADALARRRRIDAIRAVALTARDRLSVATSVDLDASSAEPAITWPEGEQL